MNPYRCAPLTSPPAPSWWQQLRARWRRWYWRNATAIDWQRAEVRESLGGEWVLDTPAAALGASPPLRDTIGDWLIVYDARRRGVKWWRPEPSTCPHKGAARQH